MSWHPTYLTNAKAVLAPALGFVFSDTGGTAAAVVDGNVRSILDPVTGNLCVFNINCTLKTDRLGFRYLSIPFNCQGTLSGVSWDDDFIYAAALVRMTDHAGGGVQVFASGTTGNFWYIGAGGPQEWYAARSSGATTTVSWPVDCAIVEGYYDSGAGTMNLAVNGSEVTGSAVTPTGTISGDLTICGDVSGTYDFVGRFYGCVIAGEVTNGERINVRKWFKRNSGQTRIVCDGNSLTASPSNYPTDLETLLNNRYGTDEVLVANLGVSGQTTTLMLTDWLVHPLRYGNIGDDYMVVWEITNDLFYGALPRESADLVFEYCDLAVAAGFKTLVLTCLKRGGSPPANFEDYRLLANGYLRDEIKDHPGVVLLDIAADPRLVDNTNETYFLADHIHMTATGYSVVAELVDAKLRAELFPDTISAGTVLALQADIESILEDTDEMQADLTDGGRLDLIVDDALVKITTAATEVVKIPRAAAVVTAGAAQTVTRDKVTDTTSQLVETETLGGDA